jgi:hypothetical protein
VLKSVRNWFLNRNGMHEMFVPVTINFQVNDDDKFVISCSSRLRRNSGALCASLIYFTRVLSSPIAINVKLSVFNEASRHGYHVHLEGWRYSSTIFDLCIKWRRSASCFFRFIPEETAPRTHWLGGLVGPRAGLNVIKERKKLDPAGNQTPAARRYCYAGSNVSLSNMFFYW